MRAVIDLKENSVAQHPNVITQETDEERAARLAAIAERDDQLATIGSPIVSAVASMTRAEIVAHIDAEFSSMTAEQRHVLKALALAARSAIRRASTL